MSCPAPAISVIVPVYKRRHLAACLDSVFGQSVPMEILVVDDGSPDDLEDILNPLAAAGRIRLERRANGGVASARNFGARLAKGRYLAFLDDDDLWPAGRLAALLPRLEEAPEVSVVAGTYETIDDSGGITQAAAPVERELSFEDLFYRGNIISPGQTLIRRAAFEEAGGFCEDAPGADDLDLWFKLVRVGAIRQFPEVTLRYRLHPGNASRRALTMSRSIRRVIRRHLPPPGDARRQRLLHLSRRFLFSYAGARLVEEGKAALRRGQLSSALRCAWEVLAEVLPAWGDSRLLASALKQIAPARWHP